MSAKFSKNALTVSEKVTVFNGRHFSAERVYRRRFGRGMIWFTGQTGFRVRYEEEGLTWCRGHDGKTVDALKVASALAASRSV